MLAVIFAGGLGTRISTETLVKPKPMISINNKPILIYIINHLRKFGVNKIIISGGYKYNYIFNYFLNYKSNNLFFDNTLTKNFSKKNLDLFNKSKNKKKYLLKVINTGLNSQTGGRIFYLKNILENEPFFFATYGDGLSNVNLRKNLNFFLKSKKTCFVTAVKSPPRFGEISMDKKNIVKSFDEKPSSNASWINGGFFILNKRIFDYLKKDENFEKKTLPKLVKKKDLVSLKHYGFWQCLDTPRDKITLEKIIKNEKNKF